MKKKVLIVENDKLLRQNISELLEIADYVVKSASNGKVGLQLAHSFSPDIIICDIVMPIMDGYALLEELTENEGTHHIPVIIISSKVEKKDIRKSMNMGADDYLTKPFDEEELLAAVASRLAKVHLLKENWQRVQEASEDGPHNLDGLKKYMRNHGTYFSFQKNESIFKRRDRGNYVYLIERGAIKSYRVNKEGKEITTGLRSDNELFGFGCIASEGHYTESAIALKDTAAYGISREVFTVLVKTNPNMAIAMIEFLNETISHRNSYVLKIAYQSVRRKTAESILAFAKILHTAPGETLKIARSDLASVAGIATETMNRTLSDFKKEGLIDIEHRNIRLLQMDELANMA